MTHIEAKSIHIWLRYDPKCNIITSQCSPHPHHGVQQIPIMVTNPTITTLMMVFNTMSIFNYHMVTNFVIIPDFIMVFKANPMCNFIKVMYLTIMLYLSTWLTMVLNYPTLPKKANLHILLSNIGPKARPETRTKSLRDRKTEKTENGRTVTTIVSILHFAPLELAPSDSTLFSIP